VSQVKELSRRLLEQARSLQSQNTNSTSPPPSLSKSTASLARSDSVSSSRSPGGSRIQVSSRYQKEKIAEVMGSVERESAIIDAVMGRLDRLRLEVGEE
jgi:hypothetical protein